MIAIYEDQHGDLIPDDFAPVSVYDDGEWLVDHGGYSTYYPEGTPEVEITSQIDGPSAVAVEVTEGSDELLNEVGKTFESEPTDGETSSITDRENDGYGEGNAPWAKSSDPSDETTNQTFEFREGSDSGRVAIDHVDEAPDDAIVHATVDDEGDVEGLYYEP